MALTTFSLATSALKPRDIADRLGVQRSTVYRWIRSGELPAIVVAGAKYVLIPAYERFVERYEKRATLEEQAARYIGEGVEVEGDVPMPRVAAAAATRDRAAVFAHPADAVRERLERELAAFEAQFRVSSERVHRLYVIERQLQVPGVPDEVVPQWAGCYAAYAELSLVLDR